MLQSTYVNCLYPCECGSGLTADVPIDYPIDDNATMTYMVCDVCEDEARAQARVRERERT